jgi:hypothetical protein
MRPTLHDALDAGNSRISVRLILDSSQRKWILGKIATRLANHLSNWDVRAEIGEEPSPDVDINHWMLYLHPWTFHYRSVGFYSTNPRMQPTKSTMLITHVDDRIKLQIVKEALAKTVDFGICMSRMTVEALSRRGIDLAKLCYITPAHDNSLVPRKIVVGITSRVYSDYRKREYFLIKLAKSLSLDAFHFEIIGNGWEEIIPYLRSAGATVRYYSESGDYDQDYPNILERVRTFDYYLYTGMDEGSMGLLDALAAGAETIVTPQGFHLDIEGAISHPFSTETELIKVFQGIAQKRQGRIDAVSRLTWNEYAHNHAILWRALLANREGTINELLHDKQASRTTPKQSRLASLVGDVKFYWNTRRSVCRHLFLDSRKFKLRGKLSMVKKRLLRVVACN